MKIVHVATVAALLLATLAGAVLWLAWSDARADRAKLESALAAQQQVISQAQQRESASTQVLATTLSQIASLKQTTQTPAEILSELPRYLPLPAPLEPVSTNSAAVNPAAVAGEGTANGESAPAATGASTPTAGEQATTGGASQKSENSAEAAPTKSAPQNGVLLPSADLKPLFDYVQDCRSCDARLSAAQQDLADERTKEQALQRERDAAMTSAKGGFWTQVKRGAKWFGIGALAGVAAATVAAHH